MEDLKTVLKALPKVDKVYVKEDGSWLFNKPAEGEYMECSREDILGAPEAKDKTEPTDEAPTKVVSIDGKPSEENPVVTAPVGDETPKPSEEDTKVIEPKPAEDKPAPSPQATVPVPAPKK
jgi:hypothetical protein